MPAATTPCTTTPCGCARSTTHIAPLTLRPAFRSSSPPRGMMSPWAWQYHLGWKKAIAATWFHPGAFAAVAGWHATSAAEADDIRRLGFTQPLCISPNGVHPPVAAAESAAATYWRQEHPALAGRRVALFRNSRFHSKKRVLELIALWATAPRGDLDSSSSWHSRRNTRSIPSAPPP